MIQIGDEQRYSRFMDTIKLALILWRRDGDKGLDAVAEKLGISERTVRRRLRDPSEMTLGEFYAWCELCGKDPTDLLHTAASAARPLPERPEPDTEE